MVVKYQADLPLTGAQERLKMETASCNHADLPPTTPVWVLKAISRYAKEASSGGLDDASVLAALKFIRDWSGDTYEELAEMMGRPEVAGGAGEAA